MRGRSQQLRASGFTLVEILIALSIATVLTLFMFGAVVPWLNFKHKIDTEHRMEELKSAVTTAYQTYAMQVDSQPSSSAMFAIGSDTTNPILSSTITTATMPGAGTALNTCADNPQADALLTPYLSTSPVNGIRDGYSQPICIFVSKTVQPYPTVEGVTLYYRVIALVSTGQDGKIDVGTKFDEDTGVLTLAANGDDIGIVVSGFPIEYQLYKDSKTRLDRVADMYSTYFTSRFQGNVQRDYSIDYFGGCSGIPNSCAAYYDYDDSAGSLGTPPLVSLTAGTWSPTSSALASALGLGIEEETSTWNAPAANATQNIFEVANQKLVPAPASGPQVQEPADKSSSLPPYTALLRMQLPTPSDISSGTGPSYAIKVVTGTY